MSDQITVVVRSCGERTADLVFELLETSGYRVFHVSGSPFEETLRKAYSAALAARDEWVVMLDGDVIPLLSGLQDLVVEANGYDQTILGSSAHTLDRLTGRFRFVGVRVFRTEILPTLAKHIPPNGTQLRPETYAHRQVESTSKWRHVKSYVKCGLHGFLQAHLDVLATSFTLAQKPELNDWLFENVNGAKDKDLQIARIGAAMSVASSVEAKVDRGQLRSLGVNMVESLGIEELPPLLSLPAQDEIREQISGFKDQVSGNGRRWPIVQFLRQLCSR